MVVSRLTRQKALSIMGLQEGFTEEDLKKQYYKLAMKYHPDSNPTGEVLQDGVTMDAINEANDILRGKVLSAEPQAPVKRVRHGKQIFDVVIL